MLKIKDNVDLKELEKFGFVYGMSGWGYLDEQHRYELYIDDCNVIAMTHELRPIWIDIPNIIFDLIQAGLVEKVGK